jgi:hypothetical protein
MSNETSKRWWVSCVLLAATAFSLGAQTSSGPVSVTVGRSALFTVPPLHFLVATIVETGSKTTASEVRIEFRDAADTRRGFAKGVLMRGRPIRLRFQVPGSAMLPLRAIVLVENTDGSAPVVSLEDLDVNNLTAETKPPLPIPPPPSSDGAEANCGGWRVNRIAIPGPIPDTADVD